MDLKVDKCSADTDVALFEDQTGWALAPVVRWLMTEGRRTAEPTQLIDELCGRLVDAGAPVWRIRFYFQILHPQVAACAFTWTRHQDAAQRCVPYSIALKMSNRSG